ncbi:MAG TPA: hypothetical protein VK835_09510 [Bacteroidia bacterium]|jgi:hypothetical protein|nr:hypothetical protein [Bacteroidia bacterium]
MIGSSYSIIQLLTFSGVGLILFTVSLLTGLLFYNIKLNNNIKTYFLNSFLGLFTIICLYSFMVVGFKTINLLSGIVLIYLFLKNGNRFKFDKINFKEVAPVLYIFPIVFVLCGCFTLPTSIEYDVRFYAKIAYSLKEFRQENLYHFFNQYNSQFQGITPYHYFEMWLTSLIIFLFPIKSIIAIKYITYPFFISSICYGTLGFIKKNKFLFSVLFVFLSTLPLYIVSILGSGFPVYTDFWLRPNFITYYYILLPIFYFIIDKNWTYLYLIAIIGCAISVIIIPCLFGGIFLLSILLVHQKTINKREFLTLNSLLLAACVFSAMLFNFFAPNNNLVVNHPFKDILIGSLSIWKAVIHSIVTLCLESLSLVGVIFLLNRFKIKDSNFNYILYLVSFQAVIGILLFQSLNKLDNAYQFPYFAYAAIGFTVIIGLLLLIDTLKKSIIKYFLAGILVAICLWFSYSEYNFKSLNMSLEDKNLNNISKAWVNAVSNFISLNKEAKGGFVLSKKDLESLDPKSRSSITIQTGSFISYITDNCNLLNLTCKDTLLSDKSLKNEEVFNKVEKWMEAFPLYTQECNVNEYLKSKKIDYFICSKFFVNTDTSLAKIFADSESNYLFVTNKLDK